MVRKRIEVSYQNKTIQELNKTSLSFAGIFNHLGLSCSTCAITALHMYVFLMTNRIGSDYLHKYHKIFGILERAFCFL